MGFTPPPEKVVQLSRSALLTESFLATLRGATFEAGAIRGADGALAWPVAKGVEGWTWTNVASVLLTLATFRLLTDAALQRDGSVVVDGRTWWLCDIALCDGTRLAVAVPA